MIPVGASWLERGVMKNESRWHVPSHHPRGLLRKRMEEVSWEGVNGLVSTLDYL
jgi:hypothetical protein